jgi:hypothetical protein
MARRKNPAATRPAAARSAVRSAPLPCTGPNHDSPAAAIYAALTARPGGATTAIIADAAGMGRSAARDALAAMETAGAVTRTKGGKPGVPDIWTSAIGIPHAAAGQIAQQLAVGVGRNQHGPGGQESAGALHDDAAPDGQAGAATPDPAVVAEITKRIERILAAASAAGIVLAGSGNMSAVRAGLDEIWEQAAQARRALKAEGAWRRDQRVRPSRDIMG